jgi:surface antigen
VLKAELAKRPPRRRSGRGGTWHGRQRVALLLATVWLATAALPQRPGAQVDPDEEYVGPLINQALESERTGVQIPWRNPATGSGGMIVIERTFYRDPRTPCRDYRRTLEAPGGAPTVEIQGTGCRVGSGRWSLDEEKPKSLTATAPPATERAPPPAEPIDPEPAAGEAAPPESCPALTAAPVPCEKPAAVVDYTMPTKTEL